MKTTVGMDDWIELFDGASLAGWRAAGARAQHKWEAAGGVILKPEDPTLFDIQPGEGVLVNGPTGRTANLYTEYLHGDCELHIEFVVSQRSNSGVYMMGRYEIQILDSWLADGLFYYTCGGIYSRWINEQSVGGYAPTSNASRPPGEWQMFDVVFRAPRFDAQGNKTANACFISVLWNGVLVHEDAAMDGYSRGPLVENEVPRGPLLLQGDHGPVAFRNIRLRELD